MYKIVQNPNSFKLSSKYEEINPSRKGKTILYKGGSYKILCEVQYLKSERIKRLALGIIATVLTLGLAYLCSNKIKSLIENHKIYISDIQPQTNELGLQALKLKKDKPIESTLEQDSQETKSLNHQREVIDSNPTQKTEETKNSAESKIIPEAVVQSKETSLTQTLSEDIEISTKSPQNEETKTIEITSDIQEENLPKEISLEQAEQALNEGIEIAPEVLEKIKNLMPMVVLCETNEQVKFEEGGVSHFITFTFPDKPENIFKIFRFNIKEFIQSPQEKRRKTEELYKNSIRAKQVIMQYDLNLLKLRPTKLITIEYDGFEYAIIAEQRLHFLQGQYEQEDLYFQNAEHLNPIVVQLARFIKETGLIDVSFTNVPLLMNASHIATVATHSTQLRCGIINLEWLGFNSIEGFVGSAVRSGLIAMMPNEELIDFVLEEGRKLGFEFDQLKNESPYDSESENETYSVAENEKNSRLINIEKYHKYKKFHVGKTNQQQFFSLDDIEKLELDLEEQWKGPECDETEVSQTLTLRQVVTDVVNSINDKLLINYNNELLKGTPEHIRKARSDIEISISEKPFSTYRELGFLEDFQQNWLNRIFNALEEKGYILNYKCIYGDYFIDC